MHATVTSRDTGRRGEEDYRRFDPGEVGRSMVVKMMSSSSREVDRERRETVQMKASSAFPLPRAREPGPFPLVE